MIITSLYLYGNAEPPSPNDGAMSHYTKFESSLKILKTMTLRSSPISKQNDLNEANIGSLDWNCEGNLDIPANRRPPISVILGHLS